MKLILTVLISLLMASGNIFAQAKPTKPKIGELPIGKILSWRADGTSKNFFVQRSTDGIYYKTIGKVMVNDSIHNKFYTFLDATLSPDEVYYRVAQADHKTGIEYSDATYHCSNAPNTLALKRISDSQVDKVVIVEFESADTGEGDYKITTEIQEHVFTVYEKPIKILQGKNVLPIKVEFLDPGFYQVQLAFGEEVEKFSFVKKKSKSSGDVIVVKK